MFGMPGNQGEIKLEGDCGVSEDTNRLILHCDLNNFFASVECLYHPELNGLPVAVGGSEKKRHGIILAKNQLAKSFGVKTAEPIWQAKVKCPHLVIVPPNMDKYVKYSELIHEIYERFTDTVEPFGIDECWLDVTGSTSLLGDGKKIADDIRDVIRTELGLTVSVGVSWNKIFSKLGSDMKKPDATTVITKENYKDLVWPLPVDDLLFVGRKTSKELKRLGINTIGRLATLNEDFLKKEFGKWGTTLWAFANGRDAGLVEKEWASIRAKGIGNSTTTPHDVNSYDDAKAVFMQLSESVAHRLRESGLRGRTVCISMRTCDFVHTERQRSLGAATCVSADILAVAMGLLRDNWKPGKSKPLRSIGVRVTSLEDSSAPVQMSLFDTETKTQKKESIEKTIDKLRDRFGDDSVVRGLLMKDRDKDDD